MIDDIKEEQPAGKPVPPSPQPRVVGPESETRGGPEAPDAALDETRDD